ncbi:hypothetical protein KP509_26G039400 [Ceratopteris richardii]|uniref:Uncharacterized protein n=1 Tax=Ceratopteris richardii TaxID=49495 RepID=A0A8T2RM74_CERRI|nr:hypothetical protein KP509_26G039400 [Ceratopteris richardii]
MRLKREERYFTRGPESHLSLDCYPLVVATASLNVNHILTIYRLGTFTSHIYCYEDREASLLLSPALLTCTHISMGSAYHDHPCMFLCQSIPFVPHYHLYKISVFKLQIVFLSSSW